MLTYFVKTGLLTENGKPLGIGYSGKAPYLNDPVGERIKGVGPIPRGIWAIIGIAQDDHTGPYSLILSPVGFDAFGRSGFRMHGDNTYLNNSASHGCIIQARKIREYVNLNFHQLLVA